MSRLHRPLLLSLLAATFASGCFLAPTRSNARVTEVSTTTRIGGVSQTTTSAIDYRKDGRIEEILRTADGDFLERIELSYDKDGRVEEVVFFTDETTRVADLSYKGDLLSQVVLTDTESDSLQRIDLSYFRGDARFVEKLVGLTEEGATTTEQKTAFRYDDLSRVKDVVTDSFVTYTSGSISTESESKSETALRYDSDTGQLTRITTTLETFGTAVEQPPEEPPVEDWCAISGYYGDGFCDSCPLPDPDCGEPTPTPAPSPESDSNRSTELYSLTYNDDGQLDEVRGPNNHNIAVSYDDDQRIRELTTRGDNYTQYVEYTYDEGSVYDYTFSPALPYGEFFDLEGGSFSTLEFSSPLDVVGNY